MHLVLGLGNPGDAYAATRHNVAWRVLDELARRHRAVPADAAPEYASRRLEVAGRAVELLQPLTFMNRSGGALAAWRARHLGAPEALLVVSDDVHLPLGALRLRARGGDGGHRGLESVAAALGGTAFARLRLGVGAAESSAELREHVLETFAPEEEQVLGEAVRRAADAVECWVVEGPAGAMNRFNRRIPKEESET